jgi:mitochondrial fission process protein 1
MAGNNSKGDSDQLSSIAHERKEDRPDFSQPLPRTKLPSSLQEALDNEEKWWDIFTQGKAGESTDSGVRYAAYARNLRTILMSAHRYVAYTSDIGESFRPVAHPIAVRAAYGISWLYIGGDVAHEGWKAYQRNQAVLHSALQQQLNVPASSSTTTPNPGNAVVPAGKVAPIDHYATVMAQRAVFQSLASMGLPAFTIHSIVKYSGRAMKDVKNTRIRTWGPIGLGLAAVPFLPYIFDKPVEEATEWAFHKAFEMVGGPEAVRHRGVTETLEKGTWQRKEGVKEKQL